MNKANLTDDDIAQLKDWANNKKIIECVDMLRTKNVVVLPNDCCIDFNAIKQMILHEL